jgi:hypothetical protein
MKSRHVKERRHEWIIDVMECAYSERAIIMFEAYSLDKDRTTRKEKYSIGETIQSVSVVEFEKLVPPDSTGQLIPSKLVVPSLGGCRLAGAVPVRHAHIRVVKLRWVHGKVSTPKSFQIRPEKVHHSSASSPNE